MLLILKTMDMTHAQATELKELMEDVAEHFCDNNQLSGELIWTAAKELCHAKLAVLQGMQFS